MGAEAWLGSEASLRTLACCANREVVFCLSAASPSLARRARAASFEACFARALFPRAAPWGLRRKVGARRAHASGGAKQGFQSQARAQPLSLV